MKTNRKTVDANFVKRHLQYLVCLLLFAVITACSVEKQPVSIEPEAEKLQDEFNIDVKYLESYDQTEITYTRHWPEGVTASIGKTKAKSAKEQSGGELLADYEVVHKMVAFDDEGYMISTSEFLEGDGEMNMPESVYEELKETMPARQAGYDPVVRTEMSDGTTRSYTKSGKLKYEHEYNPEEFKIDPALLDSMYAAQNDTGDVDKSVQQNLRQLEFDGISFDLIEDYYAGFDLPAPPEAKKHGLAIFRNVQDLRTGEIVRSAILREDGKYETITLSQYENVNGTSILASEEHFTFGEINGEWGVTYRTQMRRENIKIIKN